MKEALAVFVLCWAIFATISLFMATGRHEKAELGFVVKLNDAKELWARAIVALDKERDAHSVTRERLYAAWKDGHAIPAPPEPPPEPEMALPDELSPIWEVWESTGQEKMKTVLRQRVAEGRSVNSLLDEYGFLPPQE
jgi:hypothetical protein